MPEALVAVVGSLLGVVIGGLITYWYTRRTQVSKALHDSRIAAFARFAAAVMEYRRALMERWFIEHGGRATEVDAQGIYQTRSVAWAALFEVQLLAGDASIGRLARTAVDATSEIKNAPDRPELSSLADASRVAVEAFVNAARDDIAAGFKVI